MCLVLIAVDNESAENNAESKTKTNQINEQTKVNTKIRHFFVETTNMLTENQNPNFWCPSWTP